MAEKRIDYQLELEDVWGARQPALGIESARQFPA